MSGQPQHPNSEPSARRQRADGRSRRIGAVGGTMSGASGGQGQDGPGQERNWSSGLLHHVGDITSLALVGLTVAVLMVLWLLVGFLVDFPAWWDNVLYTATSSITLVMVFVIQHTQARQQAATQRKLDELLRALPAADNRLIAVETAPDRELEELAARNVDHREQAGYEPPTAPH
jgi:low affinity Fe/Cu permease